MAESLVSAFVSAVIAQSDYTELDRTYLTNRVYALIGEEHEVLAPAGVDLLTLKDALVDLALAKRKISDLADEADILGAKLMDFITPAPSQVNQGFWSTYKESPEQAIEDFYQLSVRNDYIKTKAIAQNIAFETETAYGSLEITINLSKPEKDPKAIAAAKQVTSTGYPSCQLCLENEGYEGRIGYPARANHRIIRFAMDQEEWGFQYSPYAYFNEHCIFLDSQHQPMAISPKTFHRLLTIVSQFPGYFAGSNADLPIVGGSILTHDHYQGGRHTFPMERAPLTKTLTFASFPQVKAGIVKWPMSVIRLRGTDQEALVALATKILDKWRSYSDDSVQIKAETDGQPHHTITPIARFKDGQFELDLVLRDNQTSAEFPDGIYHPHPDVQHIKKENIGLIEVMGLAILPPRLKQELAEVEAYLLGQVSQVAPYHQVWADQLKTAHPDVDPEAVTTVVQEAIGKVFQRVLEDAGVFKQDQAGQAAFDRFVEAVGLEK